MLCLRQIKSIDYITYIPTHSALSYIEVGSAGVDRNRLYFRQLFEQDGELMSPGRCAKSPSGVA